MHTQKNMCCVWEYSCNEAGPLPFDNDTCRLLNISRFQYFFIIFYYSRNIISYSWSHLGGAAPLRRLSGCPYTLLFDKFEALPNFFVGTLFIKTSYYEHFLRLLKRMHVSSASEFGRTNNVCSILRLDC